MATKEDLILDAQMGLAAAQTLGPFIGPEGALAVAVAQTALNAIVSAAQAANITDEQLAAKRAEFDAAEADDKLAQAEAAKKP
jgi:hypothetical protein